MPVPNDDPPHGLQLVLDFVNTLDRERATDQLDTLQALGTWLSEHGLLSDGGSRLSAPQHERAIALREALRATMLTHNGIAVDDEAADALDHVSARGQLSVRFEPRGRVRLGPRDDGFAGALAAVLVPVASAAADDSWLRVKACPAENCQWAFYDRSRNHSARWCDMAVCGNRTKVRTYRTRRLD